MPSGTENWKKKGEKTKVEEHSMTRKSLQKYKKEMEKEPLYPQLPMDVEGSDSSLEENGFEQESEYNRIPENSWMYEPYQTKPEQSSQSNFAMDKSCEAGLQQNQYKRTYPLPVRKNDKNNSQSRVVRNRKALLHQESISDDGNESPAHLTENIKHQQNVSVKPKQAKAFSPSRKYSHDSNFFASPKPGKHKKFQETSIPSNKVVQRQQIDQITCMDNFSNLLGWKALLLFFAVPFLLYYFKNGFSTNEYQKVNQLNATDVVRKLKAEFGEQPIMSFRIIHSALKKVSESDSKAPAIIVLLAANGSETVCNKFAHKLNHLLPYSSHVQISGVEYRSSNTNISKKEIDDSLKGLKVEELNSVLVEDLDRIPGEVALIFHTYWDHENAPNKKAVYIMTVGHGKAIDKDAEPKVWDKALQDHLYVAWSDIGVDQISPLLSRLSVSVVAIVA
ncbi:hypothetical protein TNIN_272521 [Trichonephila inaurata madagascariensis]|uniref:Torsin-1A-interacting protein 1/2 AAA+ activator domain-containing protein n=1 Tax=Trichonephila inaurata madagascariensis TaxID=2747483 RepID=A0A8X6YI10_9ARAC|nr:hypothetical protein TNIN_272521 [Trichonephila inaurata madagascariensis]